ncbi:hypothetical protein EBZ38_17645, partial [bacterium]|nr:hypothetical protein [bacterium]
LFSNAVQATPTSLNLFSNAVQATSAGAVIASTLNATTSVAIKNNTSLLEFRDTADAVQFASVTGSTSGLDLNLPDTADSYTFKVNNVTKAVIDNNGINGQYVTTQRSNELIINYSESIVGGAFSRTVASSSISGIATNAAIMFNICFSASSGSVSYSNLRILVTGPGGFSVTRYFNASGTNNDTASSAVVYTSTSGAYNFSLICTSVNGGVGIQTIQISNTSFTAVVI